MNVLRQRAEALQAMLKPVEQNKPAENPVAQESIEKKPYSLAERAKQLEAKRQETQPEEESFLRSTGRNIAAGAARAGEVVAGLPGDIHNLFESLITGGAEFLTGKPLKGHEEYIQKVRELDPEARKLPGSEQIRKEITQGATGQFLEPRGKVEEAAQETVKDITSFLLPGSGGMKLMSKIAIPLIGQSAKQISKYFGGEESQGDLAKLGTMMALSISGLGDARKFATGLMNRAEQAIPESAKINAQPVVDSLSKLSKREWFKGAPTPSKKPAKDFVEHILTRIDDGQMDVRGLAQLNKDINETAKGLGAFDIVQKSDKRAANAYLNQVKDAVQDGLAEYGKTNPEWWQQYGAANKAFGVSERSKTLAEYIRNNIHKPIVSNGVKLIFGGATYGGLLPHLAAVGATGQGLSKFVQISDRIANSPELRKHYLGVLQEAAKGNSKAMARHLEILDKSLAKEEKKKPS